MNKLKELLAQGWTISACYEDKFYLVASCGLDVIRTASHADLEMAAIELYEKCMINDNQLSCATENKMNKVEELFNAGWVVSGEAIYNKKYILVANFKAFKGEGKEEQFVSGSNLERAIDELYEKCMAANKSETAE